MNAGETAQDIWEAVSSTPGAEADSWRDTAAAYVGAHLAEEFDTWSECECRRRAKLFVEGKIRISELLAGDDFEAIKDRESMTKWVTLKKKKIDDIFRKQEKK